MGTARSLTFLPGPGRIAEARAPGERGAGRLTGGRQCWTLLHHRPGVEGGGQAQGLSSPQTSCSRSVAIRGGGSRRSGRGPATPHFGSGPLRSV